MRGFQRERGHFYVIEKFNEPVKLNEESLTSHYSNDRGSRNAIVSLDETTPLYSFVVDTGHPNGNEIHTITEKAEIIIQNERTGKIVTVLFARPAQITRYWHNMNESLPNTRDFNLVMIFAKSNVDRNLNNL
jgi:hypothetical protein